MSIEEPQDVPDVWRPYFARQRIAFTFRDLDRQVDGVSLNTIRRALQGVGEPSRRVVNLISATLGMHPDEFLEVRSKVTGEAPTTPFVLPTSADQLNRREREAVLSIVNALLDARDRTDDRADQPALTPDPAPAARTSGTENEKTMVDSLARVVRAYGSRFNRQLGVDWAANFYQQASAGHLDEETARDVQGLRNVIAHSTPAFELDEQEQMLARVLVLTAAAMETVVAAPQDSFELAASDNSEIVWGPPGRITHVDDGSGERELDASDRSPDRKPTQAEKLTPSPAPRQSDYDLVARTRDPRFRPQDPDAYENTIGEAPDPDGPEDGA